MKLRKNKILCLLLAALMLLSLTACGGDDKEPAPGDDIPEESKATVNAALWDLVYDEADGWVYEKDDFSDKDTYSKIIMSIPKEDEDGSVVTAEIRVSIEEPYTFRDYLTSYGFDEYEYAVKEAYDLTEVGGVGCLKQEGNTWGSPCLRYFNRVEGAGATVFIEIVGDYEDERVDKLLSGLTIKLEDTGNKDGPWAWDGEEFSAEPRSAMVGTYTLNSEWIPIKDCIVTKETFNHAIAVSGDQAFLLVDSAFKRYDFDGTSLKFAEDIKLNKEYEDISADKNGTIWLADFMAPLICWKDGAQTASYEGPDHVTMHPSGTWGISWFSKPECDKISFSDGTMKTAPIVFSGVKMISHLFVDENHIYISGSAADDSGHKVFIYDKDGNLQKTLADSDGSGLGSITYVTETANGYFALDGNMREIVLWTKDGAYIGAVDDGDLFGTHYPWFCGATKLDDGSILAVMTETRADKSAKELVAFKVTGF